MSYENNYRRKPTCKEDTLPTIPYSFWLRHRVILALHTAIPIPSHVKYAPSILHLYPISRIVFGHVPPLDGIRGIQGGRELGNNLLLHVRHNPFH
jgi:hypothetical protein